MHAHDDGRLQEMSTILSQVVGAIKDREFEAQAGLLQRYQRPILRYLAARTRNLELAADVFQEFALKLLRGDLQRYDPGKGRFRDYLRKILSNLLAKHFHSPVPEHLPAELADPQSDCLNQEFIAEWRSEILCRTWAALAALQRRSRQPCCTALRLRVTHPKLSSAALADYLTVQVPGKKPYTDAGVRKLLERARKEFSRLLVTEVARTLQTSDVHQVEKELGLLNLLGYCDDPLAEWHKP